MFRAAIPIGYLLCSAVLTACAPRFSEIVYTDPDTAPRHTAALPAEQIIGAAVKYPPDARRAGVGGTVVVRFVVETDGSLSSFEALESPRTDMAEAAIAAVRTLPRFEPGRHKGKPCRTRVVAPVLFVLD